MRADRARLSAVLVAALIVVALVAAFELGLVPLGGGPPSSTSCPGCAQQTTVVDVIMPYLGTGANASNPNRVINMTQGSVRTFEVDVYPTSALSVELGFNSIPVSSGTSSGGVPSAVFQPPSVSIEANGKGTTEMTVTVPAAAAPGAYDTVVSATNQINGSQVWGLYFEIDVR